MKRKIFARGKTYPVKERLKQLGGEWKPQEKVWEFKIMPNKPLKGVWFETEIVLESMGEIQEALEISVEDFKRKQEVFFQEFATKPKFKGIEEENIRKRYATAPVPIIMYGFRRYCWNHVRFLVESDERFLPRKTFYTVRFRSPF